jgi:hypothetical protein
MHAPGCALMEVTVTYSSSVCADVSKPLNRRNVQHQHWPNWIMQVMGLLSILGPGRLLPGYLISAEYKQDLLVKGTPDMDLASMHNFVLFLFLSPGALHDCRRHCAKICQMKDTCSIATPPSLLASLNLQMVIRKASLPWPDRMPPHARDLKMIWWPSWSDPLPAC